MEGGGIIFNWCVASVDNVMAFRLGKNDRVELFNSEDGVTREIVWCRDDSISLWPVQPPQWESTGWDPFVLRTQIRRPICDRAEFNALWKHIELTMNNFNNGDDLKNLNVVLAFDMIHSLELQFDRLQEEKEHRAYINLVLTALDKHGKDFIDRVPDSDDDCGSFGGRIRYDAACYYAILGENDNAVAILADAIQLGGYRDFKWMREDPDLRSLCTLQSFHNLFPTTTTTTINTLSQTTNYDEKE